MGSKSTYLTGKTVAVSLPFIVMILKSKPYFLSVLSVTLYFASQVPFLRSPLIRFKEKVCLVLSDTSVALKSEMSSLLVILMVMVCSEFLVISNGSIVIELILEISLSPPRTK